MGQGKKLGFEILLNEESIAGEFSYNDPNYDFLGNSIFYAISSEKNDRPNQGYENSIVGVGDNIVLIKNNQLAQEVITRILSKEFGEIWSSHDDSQFISVNPSFDSRKIKNKLTLYEFEIIHDALKEDLFRYDASELMDSPIGADKLLKFFVEYLYSGKDSLVSLLNNLDKEY